MKPLFLTNNVVGLRRFEPADAPQLFDAVHESVRELCRFMTWCRPGYSLAASQAFVAQSGSDWEKGEQYNLAMVDLEAGTLLGSIGLNRLDQTHRTANIGYWVRRSCAGRGVATAATRLIAEFGLKELGLHRLEILVPSHNAASRRVAEKAGARFEGILRNRLVLAGQRHNTCLYSLIPEDLTPAPTRVATTALVG